MGEIPIYIKLLLINKIVTKKLFNIAANVPAVVA